MDIYRRFRFVKPFECQYGKLKPGDEITVMNDRLFFNGGMVELQYYNLFMELIYNEIKNGFNYLKEVPILYNKV